MLTLVQDSEQSGMNIWEIQDTLNNILAPAICKELEHSGIHIRREQYEILFRITDEDARIQGGSPVRIIIGLPPSALPTADYWFFLKSQLKQVPKFFRSVALVRSGLLVDISNGLHKSVKETTGVDIYDIPMTLKPHEIEMEELYVVRVKHKDTGLEIRLGNRIQDSINTREKAILQLSEEVHKRKSIEDREISWLHKLG